LNTKTNEEKKGRKKKELRVMKFFNN